MGARVLGWAQRRVQNAGASIGAVNAYLGTGHNVTTAATDQSYEVTAGQSVTVTYGYNDAAGVFLEGTSTNTTVLTCSVFYETGQTLWETAATATQTLVGSQPTSATFTLTFTPTHTGTVRLFCRMLVKTTTGGTTVSDVNTDAGNFGSPAETLVAGVTSTSWSPGLVRCGSALSSLAVTGGSTPVSYPDALTATFTTAAAPGTSDGTYTLAWQDATPATFDSDTIAAGTSTSLAANRTVDNTWPHASTSVGLLLTPASSGLSTANGGTALPWVHFTALPSTPGTVTGTTDAAGNYVTARFAGAFTADPRLTKVGLLQLNDNTWGTLPLSKDAALHQRLTADLGFVAMRYRNAAGAGVNGLSVNHSLQDLNALTTAITWSDTTATEGTDAGWTNTLEPWSSALPGGTWKHTATVTAPASATGLESGYDTLTLLARNPNYQVIAGLTHATAGNEGDHAHAGDNLIANLVVLNVATDTKVQIDASSAKVSLVRYNATTGYLEALQTDGTTWSNWTSGALPTFTMSASANDAYLYQYTFTGTASWGATDIVAAQAQCLINGTSYGVDVPREMVSATANHHNTYAFDGAGFVGFGTR